ncbi:hypothetical protein [Lacticaseibacillus brantae]|uniref:Uncharacterized protein n=1 Tax=Lacticaseibacillus brantae DSM 23927 TaxID=1423727 RepID=A0A0R2AXZ6_9LACO|nr:hypothetical protein [Lacticaseibacillus brantae]KRM71653.1 hypothetical protein FC34_GL001310 [Lacticaseibacillus brantae DSM 23927]
MKFWGGILFLILAVWQGYATFNAWRAPQQSDKQQSTTTSPLNLASGALMSLVFLVLGILIVTHRI